MEAPRPMLPGRPYWGGRHVSSPLRPFRRLVPPLAGFDFSPLVAIVVLRALSALISSLSAGIGVSVLSLAVGVVAQIVLTLTPLLALLVGVRLLMSASNPSRWNPLVRFVDQVSDPLLRPFTRLARTLPVRGVALIAGGRPVRLDEPGPSLSS